MKNVNIKTKEIPHIFKNWQTSQSTPTRRIDQSHEGVSRDFYIIRWGYEWHTSFILWTSYMISNYCFTSCSKAILDELMEKLTQEYDKWLKSKFIYPIKNFLSFLFFQKNLKP